MSILLSLFFFFIIFAPIFPYTSVVVFFFNIIHRPGRPYNSGFVLPVILHAENDISVVPLSLSLSLNLCNAFQLLGPIDCE